MNKIEFRDDSLHIAGGFIKLVYLTNELYSQSEKHYFPGINGLINIYDGLTIPGNLSSLEVFLHLDTNYSTFLTIGNTTVFMDDTDGEEWFTISNSTLFSMLDYNALSKKTTPLRLGLENVSYSSGTGQNAYVFSVTDISGSMFGAKLTAAKQANYALINAILNYSGNKVGLVGYHYRAFKNRFQPLSDNNNSLIGNVSSWNAGTGTCICCGINKAAKNMEPHSKYEEWMELRAYYPFDNNANDISGNGNDGRMFGGMTCNAPGMVLGACSFDGFDDYIFANNSDSLGGGSEGFRELTFSVWINSTAPTNEYRKIGGTTFNYDGYGYNMYLRRSSPQHAFYTDNGANARFGNIMRSLWTHLVGTYNGTTMVLYINGIRVQSTINTRRQVGPNDIGLYIGDIYGYNGTDSNTRYNFSGRMDDMRIYSKALNSSQIAALAKRTGISCSNNQVETGELCDGNKEVCKSGGDEGWKQCNPSCSGWETCDTTGVCGDGLRNQGEGCDDNNTINGDGCSSACTLEPKNKVIVVMTDGQTNKQCPEQNTGNAENDAIQAACEAYNNYSIRVHSVGFGPDADITTLEEIASCGQGSATFGDIDNIISIYQQIAQNIVQASYNEQTMNTTGYANTLLYPDSYIKFNYIHENLPNGMAITTEKRFNNNTFGTFSVPEESTHIETRVVSYSGSKWTNDVKLNGISIYHLNDYGQSYTSLGDPYSIILPNLGVLGDNNIILTTGISPTNSNVSSEYNKIISTIVKDVSTYSVISAMAQGCNWTIEFEDFSNLSVNIPSNYTGSEHCDYTSLSHVPTENDAVQDAVYKLLEILDFDSDGRVDAQLTQNNLQIESTQISGIPYTWSTEVQIRTWY